MSHTQLAIELTPRQRSVLQKIQSKQTSPKRLVVRSWIILFANEGKTNSFISKYLHIKRDTVIKWRRRWYQSSESLQALAQDLSACGHAQAGTDEKVFTEGIISILSDKERSGAPLKFTAEQICQIIALACESPQHSGRAVTHWTARELTEEAIKRKIVSKISVSSVRRFLKSGRAKAS